jgi:hypothetical protein
LASTTERSRMKRRPSPPPNRTCPYRRELDIHDHTDPSDVQSRRAPALINTCHGARFAPHVGANVNAGKTGMGAVGAGGAEGGGRGAGVYIKTPNAHPRPWSRLLRRARAGLVCVRWAFPRRLARGLPTREPHSTETERDSEAFCQY